MLYGELKDKIWEMEGYRNSWPVPQEFTDRMARLEYYLALILEPGERVDDSFFEREVADHLLVMYNEAERVYRKLKKRTA
ncbi:MAG: hypothetical protein JSV63_00875 [Candidatus Aenigmatarchaeota archaeon]|nr:MAG: hypothetical protein JSV63_00875 [Candidatus Aenigmarchaeota archaeon]